MYRDISSPIPSEIISPTPTLAPVIDPEELYSIVNRYRENLGLSTLTKSVPTCAIAGARLPEIEVDWSHDGFWKYEPVFIDKLGHVGENLARNQIYTQNVMDAWLGSKLHKENIDRPIWNHMCIVTDGKNVVQIFSD